MALNHTLAEPSTMHIFVELLYSLCKWWFVRQKIGQKVLEEFGPRLMELHALSQMANCDDRLREWLWQR